MLGSKRPTCDSKSLCRRCSNDAPAAATVRSLGWHERRRSQGTLTRAVCLLRSRKYLVPGADDGIRGERCEGPPVVGELQPPAPQVASKMLRCFYPIAYLSCNTSHAKIRMRNFTLTSANRPPYRICVLKIQMLIQGLQHSCGLARSADGGQ